MILVVDYVGMHISRASWSSSNGKVYVSIYLRESYREGPHVRKRNIANLTHADPQEIAALELALKYKGDLAALGSLDQIQLAQGLSLGAVWTAADVLGLQRGFDANDLYANLTWLSEHQQRIEDRLFARRRGQQKPALFLYDVTSSYLEGERNAYGAYGYPRDGKKGKQQI